MKYIPHLLHEKDIVLNEHHFCYVKVLTHIMFKLQTSDILHYRFVWFMKNIFILIANFNLLLLSLLLLLLLL